MWWDENSLSGRLRQHLFLEQKEIRTSSMFFMDDDRRRGSRAKQAQPQQQATATAQPAIKQNIASSAKTESENNEQTCTSTSMLTCTSLYVFERERERERECMSLRNAGKGHAWPRSKLPPAIDEIKLCNEAEAPINPQNIPNLECYLYRDGWLGQKNTQNARRCRRATATSRFPSFGVYGEDDIGVRRGMINILPEKSRRRASRAAPMPLSPAPRMGVIA